MLRLSELIGRAVVDMKAAEKLGEVDEVILAPEACRVAGFIVSRGSALLGGGQRMSFAGGAVHSIGPDAVTVEDAVLEHAEGSFAGFPRRRDIVGRKVVGHSGKMYGHISDVLIESASGRILGYSVDDSPLRGLDGLFGASRNPDAKYVRADADLRVGSTLVMVPDDAMVVARSAEGEPVEPAGAPPVRWEAGATGPATPAPSAWLEQGAQPPAPAPPLEPAPEPAFEEFSVGRTQPGTRERGPEIPPG
jgi:uncharacterized protein YrrD